MAFCQRIWRFLLVGTATVLFQLPAAQAQTYTFTTIDISGAESSIATGINATGQIVGTYNLSGFTHGYLRNGDTITAIDVPNALGTGPGAINARGQIAGTYTVPFGASVRSHGFVWENGVFTFIDVPGAFQTRVVGINDRGQIVGDYS